MRSDCIEVTPPTFDDDPDAIYVDETIVHAKLIREHMRWDEPFGFFRAPNGLGQGLGCALGIKMALRPCEPDARISQNPCLPWKVKPVLTTSNGST